MELQSCTPQFSTALPSYFFSSGLSSVAAGAAFSFLLSSTPALSSAGTLLSSAFLSLSLTISSSSTSKIIREPGSMTGGAP